MLAIYALFVVTLSQNPEVELNSKIRLGWFFDGDSIVMNLTCHIGKNGFCGFGFGLTMYNTDMIWMAETPEGIIILDSYSKERSAPVPDMYLEGGTSDLAILSAQSVDGVLSAQFSRLLDTRDRYDFLIDPGMETDFCYAWYPENGFYFHFQHYGVGKLVLAKDAKNAKFKHYGKYWRDDFDAHSKIMTVAWILLANLGIISARYFKPSQFWIIVHSLCGTAVTALTIYTAFHTYKKNEKMVMNYTEKEKQHSRIGHAIAGLVAAQFLLGILSRVFIYYEKKHLHVSLIRQAHQFLGRALLVAATANVWLGWKVYENNHKTMMIWFFIIIGLTYFILEVSSYLYPKLTDNSGKEKAEGYQLLSDVGFKAVFNLIHTKGMNLVFYDNLVLDVSDFIKSHPGGAYMLRSVIGENVGKYLNGSSSLPGFNTYNHSFSAFTVASMLKERDLGFDREILKGVKDLSRMEFEVFEITQLCGSVKCVELRANGISLAIPSGTEWMGKSFLVTVNELTFSRRYYSCVLCDLKNWNSERNKNIRLYIKSYVDGKVSSTITQMKKGEKLVLKGPIGPGLMLSTIKNGMYMAFAGGTGLLPFMDLVHLIWNNEAQKGFTLFLYISFSTIDDIFGYELLKETEKAFPEKLILQLNITQGGNQNIVNSTRIKEIKSNFRLRKIWICGSSGFSGFIKEILKSAKIPNQKIINL